MFPGQVFGLAGSSLLARLPKRIAQCRFGFRTCSPLRGSSGFSPDSLFTLNQEEPRNGVTISWVTLECKPSRL